MGSSSGGVGGSSSPSGGGNTDSSSPSNDSRSSSDNNSPSGTGNNNDRDSSNDQSSSNSNSNNGRPDRESFNDTMSAAAASSGNTFGGLANNDTPNNQDANRAADEAAQNAARDSFTHANEFSGVGPTGAASSQEHANEFSGLSSTGGPSSQDHANEFSGLGPTGGPPTGNDSLNSHRGYGPDSSLAGGIDQDVNAGLEAKTDQEKAAQNTDATDLVGPVGYGVAGLQAGVQVAKNYTDYNARAAAASTLTKGNGGNLPAGPNMGRADLAKQLTDTRSNVGKALSETPFGPNAKSTQQLSAATKPTVALGVASKAVGWGLQPAAGAVQGYINTPEDASWAERMTNTVLGAAKEIDDTALSYGAGTLAALGTVAVSPAAGPAAPAVAVVGAPAAGMGAAVAMGEVFNESPPDELFDSAVEFTRPAVQFGFEKIESGVGLVKDGIEYVADNINQWENDVIDRALNEIKK